MRSCLTVSPGEGRQDVRSCLNSITKCARMLAEQVIGIYTSGMYIQMTPSIRYTQSGDSVISIGGV